MTPEPHTNPTPQSPRGFLLLRGLILPIPRSRKFIVGRDKNTCDVALPDQRVSKQHLIIMYRENKYVVTDLESVNGTYLNGEKIHGSITLVPGDEINVTPFSMLFIGSDQMQTSRRDRTPEPEQSHFSGQLETLKVVDLIQLINSTGQSGQLNLRDNEGKRASLSFVSGEIVAAEHGTNSREKAVYSVLGMKHGEFDFIRGQQKKPETPIQSKTLVMLFEGCQLIDENRLPDFDPADLITKNDTVNFPYPF